MRFRWDPEVLQTLHETKKETIAKDKYKNVKLTNSLSEFLNVPLFLKTFPAVKIPTSYSGWLFTLTII